MLPSRGIVRSLPSGALQRHLSGQSLSSRTLCRNLGNARQFGTALRSSSSPRARVGVKGAVVLGGVSATRTLSLWGWGTKKTEEPIAEATTTTSTTTTPTTAPETFDVESTTISDAAGIPAEAVADSTNAAAAMGDSSVQATDIDLAAIADLANADVPEGLGFLSAIGLDYGWGPTSVMQWFLEHVHVYGDLSWGGSIVATALLLRAVMFYPQLRSLKFNALMAEVKKDPRSIEAMELTKKGLKLGDKEMQQKGQFLAKMVNAEYGAAPMGIGWTLLQVPFSFGLFRVLNGMVHIPVPALENAGFLWFPDLTASDPYFLLPALGTSLLFGAMVVNAKYTPAAQQAMMKKMMWVLGTGGFLATTFLSAGVNLMMVSTGMGTLLTALIFNTKAVRRAVGLPIPEVEKPKYEAPRPTQSTGVSGLRERLTDNLDEVKKGFSTQIENYTGQYAGTEKERAEKRRQEHIRKLEDMRRKLERDEFQKKYKQ
ncbi:hypothetical protein FZEAL_5011 [Fusarium zealandicum]|uniref:Membrane insertase YidC/Oxa/ALB C-terminal domain-containing protein n=1 Tax=Fusarium zealandicum TaxID=1053134 RepID=A0A8H4ULD4_9HYPO|nr:hypothetical protein FZEAL_5011 [Fusarium zealandicum]